MTMPRRQLVDVSVTRYYRKKRPEETEKDRHNP